MAGYGKVVAVVPAKRRSRRLPDKNIKPLGGRPLVYYSIRVALAAERVDATFVSTDSDTVAGIARDAGATVIPRPAELATDTANNFQVLCHVAEYLEEQSGSRPEYVMLLQPTYPLRFPHELDEAVEALTQDPGFDSLVTVREVRDAWGRIQDGRLAPAYPLPCPKSERDPLLFLTHSIYLLDTERTLERGTFLGSRIKPLVVEDSVFEVDINTEIDFEIAELVLRAHTDRFGFLD